MKYASDMRHGRHCVFNIHVHLVFVAKYRKALFDAAARLQDIFTKVCLDFEAELKAFNGEKDHVHLLIHYPPKVAVSKLVNSLKGVSSRLLGKERPDLSEIYHRNVLWSPSYFAASCGGAPLLILERYLEQQKTSD